MAPIKGPAIKAPQPFVAPPIQGFTGFKSAAKPLTAMTSMKAPQQQPQQQQPQLGSGTPIKTTRPVAGKSANVHSL